MNKYESDALIFELKNKGFEATDNLEEADAYIINTCAVTNEAEKKSRQMIERARKFNANAKIFVMGCASQNRPAQFDGKGVEFIIGNANKKKILEKVEADFANCNEVSLKNNFKHECENSAKQLLQNSSNNSVQTSQSKSFMLYQLPNEYEDNLFSAQCNQRAFIKIQDGCNNFCTYCIIPYLRGRSRSRNVESILSEVEKLPENVKEIVLVGIDVSDFQINGKRGLGILLKKLDGFGKRLRLSSMEDNLVDEEFLQQLASLKNFCPHFHLSLQSGCDSVLKKMNRHYTTAQFEESVKLIRKYFPLAGITTDIIVGFPTETEEDFAATLAFVEKVKFSQLHIFPYSKRDGTAAAKLYKDLPSEVKHSRAKRLTELGKQLQQEFFAQNTTGKVLIEEKVGKFCVGYTENYIRCFINANLQVGEVVKVNLTKPFKNGMLGEQMNI